MNIIISPFENYGFYCRPDSTLLRAISDYYLPDYVEGLSISPVYVVKTLRAGKAISERFASRYIDKCGFGALIHPRLNEDFGSVTSFIANSLDYTSLVPNEFFPFLEKHTLSLDVDYQNIYSELQPLEGEVVSNKICEISKYCSLRIGDFLLFELTPAIELKEKSHVKFTCDDKVLFEFSVID